MPLQKILFKPGVNRENTRYTTEGGWYDCDKIRFRQGTPEKIGGWVRISNEFFLGVCRSLWNWVTLSSQKLLGVGTNLKFYIENGGAYYDITPIRTTLTLGANPFTTVAGSSTVTVSDATGGYITGDFVTFSGATAVGGLTLNGEYQLTTIGGTPYVSYTITAANTASASATGGGTLVQAEYQLNVGPAVAVPLTGWGAGYWGSGAWGQGVTSVDALRIWNQTNFGQDLIFGPRGEGIYYWAATDGLFVRGANLNTLGGAVVVTPGTPASFTFSIPVVENMPVQFAATGSMPTGILAATTYYVVSILDPDSFVATISLTPLGGAPVSAADSGTGVYVSLLVDVPIYQNYLLVSDASRFVLAFGTNDILDTALVPALDPMLIRWSDTENATCWTPALTNQAGSIRLSHGSKIVTAQQSRQEILVWTDASLYSLQYLGPPYVWQSQLLADNISIVGPNATALASGVSYWMGVDKFYKYDGRVQTLRCDLRQYIFQDINALQYEQVCAGTNEGFNEIWWFYCPAESETVSRAESEILSRYVVYNYAEDIWYYGTMNRTAWLDSGVNEYPLAATYSNNIVNHEDGVDNSENITTLPIEAYITSSEFDIGDGHNFGFVWRILPDITFRGSTAASPQATMYLMPLQNSGSGYNTPPSVGGVDFGAVTRTAVIPVEQFTGQINIRVRGRQMAFKIASVNAGVTWQLGAPRMDIRPDGRR